MKLKLLKFFGVILSFILAFPLHFLYDKIPSFITSIFLPVNESIAEHMKIIFGSIILSGIVQKIIILKTNMKANNVCFSHFIGAVLAIPIFLIIFVPIYSIIGENLPITLIIMFITFLIAHIISYIIMTKDDLKLEKLTILFVLIIYVIFGILTYFTPQTNLFMDPIDLCYGINC